jgi:hypothetical protein
MRPRSSVLLNEMLSIVRIGAEPSPFILRSAVTASSATTCVFAHVSGGSGVVPKTISGISAIRAELGFSSSSATICDNMRWVFAPITMTWSSANVSSSHAKGSGQSTCAAALPSHWALTPVA